LIFITSQQRRSGLPAGPFRFHASDTSDSLQGVMIINPEIVDAPLVT
jgi:hypothetical protein